MKYLVFQTEILYNVYKGIYLQTNYYSDGSIEELLVPKGIIIMHIYLGV